MAPSAVSAESRFVTAAGGRSGTWLACSTETECALTCLPFSKHRALLPFCVVFTLKSAKSFKVCAGLSRLRGNACSLLPVGDAGKGIWPGRREHRGSGRPLRGPQPGLPGTHAGARAWVPEVPGEAASTAGGGGVAPPSWQKGSLLSASLRLRGEARHVTEGSLYVIRG